MMQFKQRQFDSIWMQQDPASKIQGGNFKPVRVKKILRLYNEYSSNQKFKDSVFEMKYNKDHDYYLVKVTHPFNQMQTFTIAL